MIDLKEMDTVDFTDDQGNKAEIAVLPKLGNGKKDKEEWTSQE